MTPSAVRGPGRDRGVKKRLKRLGVTEGTRLSLRWADRVGERYGLAGDDDAAAVGLDGGGGGEAWRCISPVGRLQRADRPNARSEETWDDWSLNGEAPGRGRGWRAGGESSSTLLNHEDVEIDISRAGPGG